MSSNFSTEVQAKPLKRPDWIKVRLKTGKKYSETRSLISGQRLHTVCEEARCPNIYECWEMKTATIMILGDICTRACGFCSVKTGKPGGIDETEPVRTAVAVKEMGLEHVVITSVDRDDLKNDYGAGIWAETIKQIHQISPGCSVEVLTPDFKGYTPSLDIIFAAGPDIFSHNVECVPRLSRQVRTQADWKRSKGVLHYSVMNGLNTKTGMMVGLGETDDEVLEVMNEMADLGVNIFNIGQYLQPTPAHLKVKRFVHPDIFNMYKEEGLGMGFTVVESAPLVRSSYHAGDQLKNFKNGKGKK